MQTNMLLLLATHKQGFPTFPCEKQHSRGFCLSVPPWHTEHPGPYSQTSWRASTNLSRVVNDQSEEQPVAAITDRPHSICQAWLIRSAHCHLMGHPPCSTGRCLRLKRASGLNYSCKFVGKGFQMELSGVRQEERRGAGSSVLVADNLGLPAWLPPPALSGGDEHVIFQLHTPSSRLQWSKGRFRRTHANAKCFPSFQNFKSNVFICSQEKE